MRAVWRSGIFSHLQPQWRRRKLFRDQDEFHSRLGRIKELANRLQRDRQLATIDVFRTSAALRFARIAGELEEISNGNLTFDSTETWRTLYEQVLQACETKRYLSVALVLSDEYWRHPPGDQTLNFNYRLIWRGFRIERIFIIDDFLWPPKACLPCTELSTWIQSQADHRIDVKLIRASELDEERDLMRDFGIYGELAVGYQVTDTDGLTVRYEISFQPLARQLAADHWAQLQLYARSRDQLLDRAAS